MNTNLKAIGLVLKESIKALNDRIDAQVKKSLDSNSILESAFFKALDANSVSIADMETSVDEFKTLLGLNAEIIDADISKAVDEMKADFYESIKNIPGTPGEKGDPGIDGEYIGMDQARKYVAGNECAENELYTHAGGLWKCAGPTFSEPSTDNDRWILVANGITSAKSESNANQAELSIALADGTIEKLSIEIPAPNYLNAVFEKGQDYATNDVVWLDGHSFIALVDSPHGQPGESKDWSKHTMRGRAGRKGDAGEPGKAGGRGAPGIDGLDGPDDVTIKGFINHILTADDSDTPIRRSRGKWVLDDQYSVGDVVNMGSGLYLCIQAHAGRAPASDHMAGDYWRVLVPAAGAGVGGGGSIDTSAFQQLGQRGQASGYAPLDANNKVPTLHLPASNAAPHHIFATQADMLAGGSAILAGEKVLVHGDPQADNNGEYVALQDAPTTLAHYDHLGEHVASHRHDGTHVDVNEPFSGGTRTLQQIINDPYTAGALEDKGLAAGDLRKLEIGKTYLFPTTDVETAPGSGVMVPAAITGIVGISDRGHKFVNALMIRTSVQTWVIIGQEYTGTNKQQTILWNIDLDPAWPDHTGIGGSGATSFTSITNDILAEIGDSTLLGADNLVDRIIHNESERHLLSSRVATLEGATAHQHADIIQDFKLQVNNQGPTYAIVNDRPTNPDHVGKDLFDGVEHKVLLEWDTAAPYSQASPFDPANVEGGSANWVTGQKPHVWIQHGSDFKQLVDPLSDTVFAFAAISQFVDQGSILTVKWDNALTRLDVIKVQQATVHIVTSPDHQPLQAGGSVDAKSVPFVSLDTAQQAAVKANSFWLDETQTLHWRDNTSTDHVVTMTP